MADVYADPRPYNATHPQPYNPQPSQPNTDYYRPPQQSQQQSQQQPQYISQEPEVLTAEQAERARRANVTDEQAVALEKIDASPMWMVNDRFTRAHEDARSLAALGLEISNISPEHQSTAEVFPDQPGKFTLKFLKEKARDPFMTGAIQNAIDMKQNAKLAVYLVDWLLKSLYSWNASDSLTRDSIMDMEPELGKLVFEALMRTLNSGEGQGSASTSR